MGPLILLSLLGIGAATAFVDVSNLGGSDADGKSDDAEPDNEVELDDTQETASDQGDAAQGIEIASEGTETVVFEGSDEADILHARGEENIDAGDGDDTLTSWGSGMVLGGEGNDVFEIGGAAEAHGGDGEDYMHISEAGMGFGGDGDDTFFLKNSQIAEDGPASANGGDGDDTFIMRPLAGLPEETVAHRLTGGEGADTYALDIDSAINIRPGDVSENRIIASITDFDPEEDVLLVDLGASSDFDDVDDLTLPALETTVAEDGAYTDVHISWTNPLNPDNVETRTIRLEGIDNFDPSSVKFTSAFDPDSHLNDQPTGDAAAHHLSGMTVTDGTTGDDVMSLNESSAATLNDGNDTVEITGGAHLIYGGDGDDSILVTEVSTDAAHLFGGEGDDILTADMILNNDTALIGGAGDDNITFGLGHYVEANDGHDTLVLNVHPNAIGQGPAVLQELTGNHLTLNIPSELDGEVEIVNYTYANGFEVAYSEIFVGDVAVLKVMEEDYDLGIGIAEIDPRITIVRDAAI